MRVRNARALIDHPVSTRDREARGLVIRALEAALQSIDPMKVMRSRVRLKQNLLKIDSLSLDLRQFRRVFVIGGGKAAGPMALALEEVMAEKITGGLVNIPKGASIKPGTEKVTFHEAGHPLPDFDGVQGTKLMVNLVRNVSEKDLVICLISGGGSALMPLPVEGLSLADKQKVTDALLKAGARISEINAVRKHISRLKGGRLAELLYPAEVLTLVFSDVVGDYLDVIASGPTAADTSTFQDALDVLKKYETWQKLPQSVKSVLLDGKRGKTPETPKAGDKVFNRVHNLILCNNEVASTAAVEELRARGLESLMLTTFLEGESEQAGTFLSSIAEEVHFSNAPVAKPGAIVLGGETTVTVKGKGRGGRNQELALGACSKIGRLKGVAIASVGTDGIDGSTDAAGAIVDGATLSRAKNLGLDPIKSLRNNDSYTFFSKLGDLVFTGPTGTNVNDLSIAVVL